MCLSPYKRGHCEKHNVDLITPGQKNGSSLAWLLSAYSCASVPCLRILLIQSMVTFLLDLANGDLLSPITFRFIFSENMNVYNIADHPFKMWRSLEWHCCLACSLLGLRGAFVAQLFRTAWLSCQLLEEDFCWPAGHDSFTSLGQVWLGVVKQHMLTVPTCDSCPRQTGCHASQIMIVGLHSSYLRCRRVEARRLTGCSECSLTWNGIFVSPVPF